MACTQILAGITLDCASSVGGIKEVYIANYDDVDTEFFRDPSNNE